MQEALQAGEIDGFHEIGVEARLLLIGIPVFLSFVEAHSTKVKGLGSIPTGAFMGFMFSEHVWLDG